MTIYNLNLNCLEFKKWITQFLRHISYNSRAEESYALSSGYSIEWQQIQNISIVTKSFTEECYLHYMLF